MENKTLFLSHFLSESTPGYGGHKDVLIEKISCICNGDSSNTFKITLKNHVGTHIDLPKHFYNNGKTLSGFPADFWFFNKPQLLTIDLKENQLLLKMDLEGKVNLDTDFLLIKSGFETKRSEEAYWKNGPGISEEVGFWLRDDFPKLKCIGFDLISLTAYQHREEGRRAHRAFLNPYKNHEPILIVEDMSLSNLISPPKKIIISPLLIENADGVQVTVFAEV